MGDLVVLSVALVARAARRLLAIHSFNLLVAIILLIALRFVSESIEVDLLSDNIVLLLLIGWRLFAKLFTPLDHDHHFIFQVVDRVITMSVRVKPTVLLVTRNVVWLVAIVDEPSRHLRSHFILLATTAEFSAERSSS